MRLDRGQACGQDLTLARNVFKSPKQSVPLYPMGHPYATGSQKLLLLGFDSFREAL